MAKIVKFSFTTNDGRTDKGCLKIYQDLLVVHTWGGECVFFITHGGMQNGQTDYSVVYSSCDSPIEQHLLSGNIHGLSRDPIKAKDGVKPERLLYHGNKEAPYTKGVEELNEVAAQRIAEIISNGYFDDKSKRRMARRVYKYLADDRGVQSKPKQEHPQTHDEAYRKILDIFPKAETGEDNDGQLVVYTGLKVGIDEKLVPFEAS